MVFTMMSACTNPKQTEEDCKHTYSSCWEYNSKEHFHRATCEHKNLTKDNETHTFDDWHDAKDESKEERICKICEYVEIRDKTTQDCKHIFGDWEIVTEPTLDADGKIKRVCSKDKTYTEEFTLPKLNGENYTYKEEKTPTCVEKGEASYTYDKDGQKLKFTKDLDYGPHTYGKWVMVEEPTKEKVGLLERICSVDKTHKETFELPILNETNYTYSINPATCLEDGKAIYKYTKDKQEFEFESPILATGHSYKMNYDESKHWLETTCEHSIFLEIADHNFENGICTKCEYNQNLAIPAVHYMLNETEDGYIASFNLEYAGTSIVILDTYMDLPVVSIQASSFNGGNIKSITLPSSIKNIAADAFASFNNLNDVYFDGSLSDWCNISFADKTSNPMHIASNFYQRGENYWQETTKLSIPNTVETIAAYQFYGFSHITEITLPSGVQRILTEAFAGCSSIWEFIVPDSVQQLGENILEDTRLVKLTVPFLRASETIGCYFGNEASMIKASTEKLEEITITKATYLTDSCFSKWNVKNLKKLSLPDTLRELGSRIIDGLENDLQYNEYENGYYLGNEENPYLIFVKMIDSEVTSFELHQATRFIYDGAFQYAIITEINLPDILLEIKNSAFEGSKLQKIVVPTDTKIGNSAFENCRSLEEVLLPATATKVWSNAFSGCKIKKASLALENVSILTDEVEELTLLSGVGKIDLGKYPKLKKVLLTEGITDIGEDILTRCPNLEYTKEAGIFYLGSESKPHLWLVKATDETDKAISFYEDTAFLYSYSFAYLNNLESVEISNNILAIEIGAFSNCANLSQVSFSEKSSINRIEARAFQSCTNLTSLILPASLTYLGEGIIEDCPQLEKLCLPFIGSSPNPETSGKTSPRKEGLFSWIFGSKRSDLKQFHRVEQLYSIGSNLWTNTTYVPTTLKEISILGGKIMQGAFSTTNTANSTTSPILIQKFTLSKNVEIENLLSISTKLFQLISFSLPFELLTQCTNMFDYAAHPIREVIFTTPIEEEFFISGESGCCWYPGYYTKKLTFSGVKIISPFGTDPDYSLVEKLTSVILPKNIEKISAYTFSRCTNMESIVIPKGIQNIGKDAFASTTIIYYLGTQEEWNGIEKGTLTSPVYFYSETEISNGWHYVDDVPTKW